VGNNPLDSDKQVYLSDASVNPHVKLRSASRIFVVDHEMIIASTLAAILRLNGFTAQSFVHPFEAVAAAIAKAPDLLISEVKMPEYSGVELAIRIKLLCPYCKVLLFSGQAATADLLEEARTRGHDFEVLAKPVHPNDLIKKIGKTL
jgi:DNA-binding NtrC family response regulator